MPSIILLAICLQAGTASADKPLKYTPQAFLPLVRGGTGLPGKAYYVAPYGNDSNPGTIDRPWKTIHQAAYTLKAGEGVLIRGGTYTISSPIIPTNSGIPTDSGIPEDGYIIFRGYPGETVVLRGDGSTNTGILLKGNSYISIERLTVRNFQQGLNCMAPGHHIVIRDNVFEYNWRAGIVSANRAPGYSGDGYACDYLTIEGNTVRYNGYNEDGTPATGPGSGWGSGIAINPNHNPYWFDDATSFHTVIRGNRVYHNYDGTGGPDGGGYHLEGHGIIIDRGGNLPPFLIENNVVFDNGGKGIHLYGAQNVWIVGNTLYKNCTDPLFKSPTTQAEIAVYDVPSNPVLRWNNVHVNNNIAYASSGKQITYFTQKTPETRALIMKNNLWYGNPYRHDFSPYGENPEWSDPLFKNEGVDFHLQPSSRAIDRGTNSLELGSQFVDFDGTARPQGQGYDMGAYER